MDQTKKRLYSPSLPAFAVGRPNDAYQPSGGPAMPDNKRTMPNSSSGSCSSGSSSCPICFQEALDRIGDRDIYLEIAAIYCLQMPQTLSLLQAALEIKDYDEACRHAHTVKGSSATIGAESMRRISARLEQLCRDRDMRAEAFLDALRGEWERVRPFAVALPDLTVCPPPTFL